MGTSKTDCRIERLPGETDLNFPWTIVRAKPDKPTWLVSISHDIFGVRTHFYKGRTMPCTFTGCPACERKMTSRWSGYILAMAVKDGSQVVFEFPPPAAIQLDRAFKEYQSLRGLKLNVTRTENRSNAKVTIEVRGVSDQAHKLPPDEEVWPIIAHIWGLTEHAPAKFVEFAPENLAEVERRRVEAEQLSTNHDSEWLHPRMQEVTGQTLMPLKIGDVLNNQANGSTRH